MFKKYSKENEIKFISSITSDTIISLYSGATIGCYLPESAWFIESLIGKLRNKNEMTALEAINDLMHELNLVTDEPRFIGTQHNTLERVISFNLIFI